MNVRNTIKNTIISHRVPRSMSSDVQLVITSDSLPAPLALPLVLCFGVGDGLPLHIARCISPMTGNREDVVDHVALAGAFG